MPATLPPGIGNPQQAMQATAFIREQPWYQQWLASTGKRPDANGNPQPPLSDDQQLALNKLVRQNGIGMNDKFDGIDQNGQIVEEHHKLKKAAIAAAVGGLALTGFGAAGIGPLAALGGSSSGLAGLGGEFAGTSTGVGPLASGLTGAATLGGSTAGAVGATGAGIATATDIGGVALPATEAGLGVEGATTGIGPLAGGLTGATTDYAIPAGVSSAGLSSTPSYLSALKEGGNTATDLLKGRAEGRAAEAGLTNNANRTELDLYNSQINANNAQNNYGLNAAGQENNFNNANYGLDLATSTAANNFGLGKVNAGIGIGNLDLAQKDYALSAPGKRAGNAVRGDILANAQDASIDLPSTIPKTTISGGLRPSMFSANTRALGGEMSAQALSQQRAGDTFAPLPTLPDYQGPKTALPTYKAPPAYVNPPPAPTMTPQPQANGFDTALTGLGYAGAVAPYLKYLKYL